VAGRGTSPGRADRGRGGGRGREETGTKMVEQMVGEFGKRYEFMLVIAPEGTRKGAAKWKSGFYHIAIGAGVPIVPGWIDYDAGAGGIGPPIIPTGDYAAEMAKIAAFYAEVMPGHPRISTITAGTENND